MVNETRLRIIWVICVICAAGSAFISGHMPRIMQVSDPIAFPGWPKTYANRPLHPLPMTPREQIFAKGFPGNIQRFGDGQREYIVRWVTQPTRKLHPARDCFKGAGYTLSDLPMEQNSNGQWMHCFAADNGQQSLKVCEYIAQHQGQQSWPDVSSWYWNSTTPGWWSWVIAERRE